MSRRNIEMAIVTPEEIQTILKDYNAGDRAAVATMDALDDFIQQASHTCMKCSKQFTPTAASTFFVLLNPSIERLPETPFVYAGDDCGVAALCHGCLKRCGDEDAYMEAVVRDCFDLSKLLVA
jgi:hypothetical protein